MHAKHSRQWPIIEGLVLGLGVVFKIHRLISVTPHMDPEYSHQGVSSTHFPPTEYYLFRGQEKENFPHPSVQQLELFPGDR